MEEIKILKEQLAAYEDNSEHNILEKGKLYITLEDERVEEDKVIKKDASNLMETSF